jgi:hypothetical protein
MGRAEAVTIHAAEAGFMVNVSGGLVLAGLTKLIGHVSLPNLVFNPLVDVAVVEVRVLTEQVGLTRERHRVLRRVEVRIRQVLVLIQAVTPVLGDGAV